ncbi:hypothetical protein C7447_101870 [Tenacibaculum adriaticum]|uniref:Tellurite resistance protein TerB n=1 Tax=Tenacibaculum adriaticum TaxID=413713 RepID=A0A5S5E0K0_9FLAO|nr:hypothetical protein [Tenacibaculum adriaticum]TYQ00260.1 hypothetical protein C7447_101870 [Tenacibaculum adriaticum]
MKKKLNTRFYQNVGKLFYAVAASDNVVREEEFNTLKKIVKKEWLPVDDTEDDYKTDAAYQIEIVFDWLTNKDLDANACFNDFVEYKKEHEYFFTDEIKSLISKTADTIAKAFSGKNKSELIILAKLNLNL